MKSDATARLSSLATTIIIAAISLLCATPTIHAREKGDEDTYRFDAGFGLGVSGYLGDANQSNFLKHPGFGGTISGRYIPNERMAWRAVLSLLTISGDTREMENVIPQGLDTDFSATLYDLSLRYEFNFFPYGIGETYKHLRRFTPYIAAGIGLTVGSCDGNTAAGPSIPLAIGIKYKSGKRANIAIEYSMTKVFNDKLDNLSDLNGIKSSFVKNTDWHSLISLTFTYEFGRRCATCHYVDRYNR